jgi:hypothetical protein
MINLGVITLLRHPDQLGKVLQDTLAVAQCSGCCCCCCCTCMQPRFPLIRTAAPTPVVLLLDAASQ